MCCCSTRRSANSYVHTSLSAIVFVFSAGDCAETLRLRKERGLACIPHRHDYRAQAGIGRFCSSMPSSRSTLAAYGVGSFDIEMVEGESGSAATVGDEIECGLATYFVTMLSIYTNSEHSSPREIFP